MLTIDGNILCRSEEDEGEEEEGESVDVGLVLRQSAQAVSSARRKGFGPKHDSRLPSTPARYLPATTACTRR